MVPARAFRHTYSVSERRPTTRRGSIFRIDVPSSAEASTRLPVTPQLTLPQRPRRFSGLAGSLLLHGVLIGLVVFHGERLWSRSASAGDPALARGATAGGGGGRRVAYITLPSIPRVESPPRFTVTAPVPPQKTVPTPQPDPVPAEQVIPEPADTIPVTASGDAAGTADSATGPGNAEGAGSGTTAGMGGGAGRSTQWRDLGKTDQATARGNDHLAACPARRRSRSAAGRPEASQASFADHGRPISRRLIGL